MTNENLSGQLQYAGEIRKYILGGNAIFTLRDQRTHIRQTFRVKSGKKDRHANWSTKNQDRSIFFVSVLTSGDNESGYQYIGFLKPDVNGTMNFIIGKDTRENGLLSRYTVFAKFWYLLEEGCRIQPGTEFFHEGSCCMCGRKLTVPESVASGIGPECATKEGI